MSPLDTVAAQRDAANTKVRELSVKLEAALKEIERLKAAGTFSTGGYVEPEKERQAGIVHQASGFVVAEIPDSSPPKSKRPRIFGG